MSNDTIEILKKLDEKVLADVIKKFNEKIDVDQIGRVFNDCPVALLPVKEMQQLTTKYLAIINNVQVIDKDNFIADFKTVIHLVKFYDELAELAFKNLLNDDGNLKNDFKALFNINRDIPGLEVSILNSFMLEIIGMVKLDDQVTKTSADDRGHIANSAIRIIETRVITPSNDSYYFERQYQKLCRKNSAETTESRILGEQINVRIASQFIRLMLDCLDKSAPEYESLNNFCAVLGKIDNAIERFRTSGCKKTDKVFESIIEASNSYLEMKAQLAKIYSPENSKILTMFPDNQINALNTHVMKPIEGIMLRLSDIPQKDHLKHLHKE